MIVEAGKASPKSTGQAFDKSRLELGIELKLPATGRIFSLR